MTQRPKHYTSNIAFRHLRSGRLVHALNQTTISVSSGPLGWKGVTVEAGSSGPWECDDLAVPHHYLGLNAGSVPVPFEAKIGTRFRKMMLPPGGVCFTPAGSPFTHRAPGPSRFAVVAIEAAHLDRFVALDRGALRPLYDMRSSRLGWLIRGLADEAESRGASGPLFVDALTMALGVQISEAISGGFAAAAPDGRGLGPRQLARAIELIEARLASGIQVTELAQAASLSVSRFVHAFKEAVGTAPHQFLIARRLERAREDLERGGSTIAAVAQRWGFTDQSHFTRLFRRKFGVTPGRSLR